MQLAPNFPEDTSVFSASYGSMNLFLRSRNRGFGWENARSGMLGYKIIDMAIAPDCTKSELIFVALAESGLQRSSDGGTIWESPVVKTKTTQVEVGELADGKRLVVCAGDRRILWSNDGGDTWARAGNLPSNVLSLALPRGATAAPFIAAGTESAVYTKVGDGEWRSASVPSAAHTIEFSPTFASDQTIWVGTYGHGVLVSTDAGRSFEPTVGEGPDLINDIVIAPTWPECQDIFVATPRDGVHVSRDGGKEWSKLDLPIAETYQTNNHFQCLAIASTYPAEPTVYCGCFEGLYCSNDRGEHWFETVLNPTRIGRKLAVSPNYKDDQTVYMSGYGNPIIATRDGGDSWEALSRGVRMMSPYSLATSPTYAEEPLVLLGTGNGVRRSATAGKEWQVIDLKPINPSKNIGSYEIRQLEFSRDFAKDNTCFALNAGGFYVSTDRGVTWAGKPVPVDWTWRLAVAPNWATKKTAFLGGYSAWKTTDGGVTWRSLTKTGKVLGLVCAPDFDESGQVFLVSQQRGLMRSSDGGETWVPISGSFQGYSPTKIRLSPDFVKDDTVFVSTVSGGMFKSVDRGDTWKRCAPLGSVGDACFDFIVSPNYTQDKTLFACVFGGMIRSRDDAKTWELLTDLELYDDARDPWIFRGDWKRTSNPRHLGFGLHNSCTAGATANIGFSGAAVTLYGQATKDSGICEVLLDGKVVATVDLYSSDADREFVIYQNDSLPQGFHDIEVRVTGEANEASSGSWVGVDGMTVKYQSDDSKNDLYASLENLYLDASASYGRDTKRQNVETKLIRAKLEADRVSRAMASDVAELVDIASQSPDLRSRLTDMHAQILGMQAAVKELQQQLIELDQLMRAKEQAIERAVEKARRQKAKK